MPQNNPKTELIRVAWVDAWLYVNARLAVHIVMGWNARACKSALPSCVSTGSFLPSMHDRAQDAWPAMLFLKSLVLLHGCAHLHDWQCRTFRPHFLNPWLHANSSSLLYSQHITPYSFMHY